MFRVSALGGDLAFTLLESFVYIRRHLLFWSGVSCRGRRARIQLLRASPIRKHFIITVRRVSLSFRLLLVALHPLGSLYFPCILLPPIPLIPPLSFLGSLSLTVQCYGLFVFGLCAGLNPTIHFIKELALHHHM